MKPYSLFPTLLLAAFSIVSLHAQDDGAQAPSDQTASADDQSQDATQMSADVAPPELPDDPPSPCPADGDIWTPGYYAYDDASGYYWVSGEWDAPPAVDLLWTPPYWGFGGGVYVFNPGYWGPTVGFYGGINYGYGYGGYGYYGGRWNGNVFAYNTAALHVNRSVVRHTYYDRTAVTTHTRGRVTDRPSFNGRGGVIARPDARELAAARATHVRPTPQQVAHFKGASHTNLANPASAHHAAVANGGHAARSLGTPKTAAAPRRGEGTAPSSRAGVGHTQSVSTHTRANATGSSGSPQRTARSAGSSSHTSQTRTAQTRSSNVTRTAQRQTYTAPRQTRTVRQPASSAPRQTYSAPRQTYSAPRQTYSAPAPRYSAPPQRYSAPATSTSNTKKPPGVY